MDDYGAMMGDPVRMDAYRQAIGRLCPGRVVAEIGVGLGPLSLMALRAGAQRVYGIELDPGALELARRTLVANGFDRDRFVAVPGLSTAVELPERVDVVLSETIDGLGLGENTAHYMEDARRRFLRPGGSFLPARLDCLLALGHSATHAAERRFWEEVLPAREGADLSPLAHAFAAQRATVALRPDELLTGWAPWQQLEFSVPGANLQGEVEVELRARRDGVATGVAGAFRAVLCDGVELDSRPHRARTHWQQGWLPLPELVRVREGEAFVLRLRCQPHDHPAVSLSCTLHPLVGAGA